MSTVFYLIIGLLLVGFGVLLYLLIDLKRQATQPQENESMKVMMEWMRDIKQGTESTREGMQKSIDETNKSINERLDGAARVIGALSKELGSMSQIGPDIRRLSEVLASPKTRGTFGEEILENMLAQVLPKNAYQIQYKFKNGEVVDAMIRVGDRILPIDSTFSMENFRLFKEANTDDAADGLKKGFFARRQKARRRNIQKIHSPPRKHF